MEHKLRISIVTHNSERIFEVLDHLVVELEGSSSCVLSIYDNNSDKSYIEQLKKYEQFADIIYSSENKGFGFGHNMNLLNASEKFFLVYNPDVILSKIDLDKMMEELENEEEAGMLVPKVVFENGKTQYLIRSRFTVFDWFIRRMPVSAIRNLFANRIADFECHNIPDDRNSYVELASGCFMLMKSEVFKKIVGFDDRFFMYLEDYDLCNRVNQISKIVYTPQFNVVHFWERASSKKPKLFFMHLQSIMKYFNKWGWKFL